MRDLVRSLYDKSRDYVCSAVFEQANRLAGVTAGDKVGRGIAI